MTFVEGVCPPSFGAVRDVLDTGLSSGAELGLSAAVVAGDELVVDLWGGVADATTGARWGPDTVTNVWSLTKGATTLAALLLVERGRWDLDHPLGRDWPGLGDKAELTLREVLSHKAGLPGWEPPFDVTDLYDAPRSAAALVSQQPWWEPGTACGYHAVSFGSLVAEPLRRITGTTLTRYVADELCGPRGIDLSIGVARGQVGRVAPLEPPPDAALDLEVLPHDSITYRAFTGPRIHPSVTGSAGWQGAEIGGSNGIGNARAVALLNSLLTHDGKAGVPLLSPELVDEVFRPQAGGVDLVLGIPVRYGLGYGLPEPTSFPWVPAGRVCFWGGWGGSVVVVDADRGITIAFVMNRMQPVLLGGETGPAVVRAVYASLGVEEAFR